MIKKEMSAMGGKSQKNKKNKTNRKDENQKKVHFKRNLFLILLVLIAAGGVFVYRYAQKPGQGVIKESAQSQKPAVIGSDVPEAFTGKYISFLYENSYVLKTHDIAKEDGSVILEQAYISQTTSISKKIGLTIRSLPTHLLDDCPDYKIRTINKERYKKESFDLGNVKGISFSVIDSGTFEKTFFILHGDYLAILTMSAPSLGDEKISNEVETIIRSISWLK